MGKSELRKKFGERLKAALRAANVKAVDIARDLGVTQRAVSGWTGGTREPKFEVLLFLYRRYGINPLYIITGQGPPVIEKAKGADVSTLTAQALLPGKKKLQMVMHASDRNSLSSLQVIAQNPYSQRLRRVCKELGLNAHELAKILGVPKPTVERWIYGTTKPKIEVFSLLASKFGANPTYLLTGEGPPLLAQSENYIKKRKAELRIQIETLKKMQESLERELTFLEHVLRTG